MWNASRFVMMNMEDGEEPKFLMLTSADKWILSKVNTLAKEVQESLSKYDLGLAAQKVMISSGMNTVTGILKW